MQIAAVLVKEMRAGSFHAADQPDSARTRLPPPLFHGIQQRAPDALVTESGVNRDAEDIFHMVKIEHIVILRVDIADHLSVQLGHKDAAAVVGKRILQLLCGSSQGIIVPHTLTV